MPALAGLLLCGRSGPALGPAPVTAASCLDPARPVVTLSGPQTPYDEKSLAEGTRIDARNAAWLDQGYTPVKVGGNGTCWLGGRIAGTFPDSTSWSTMHETYGMLVYGPDIVIEGIRVHDYGDGVSIHSEAAADWTIRGSHFSFVRDDCVENDFMNSGLVDDSYFDGCYTGYSARAFGRRSPRDGSANLVTIQHTLMRLQAMPTVYSGQAPGHTRFFKLDKNGISPRLALHDNVFRIDGLSAHGKPSESMYFIPPPEKLASCSNNIIVWLAPEDFPEPLPSCYRLTRDKAVWDDAVARWLSAHPHLPS